MSSYITGVSKLWSKGYKYKSLPLTNFIKFYWNTVMVICLYSLCSCIWAKVAELTCQYREQMTNKTWNSCYMALYWKKFIYSRPAGIRNSPIRLAKPAKSILSHPNAFFFIIPRLELPLNTLYFLLVRAWLAAIYHLLGP